MSKKKSRSAILPSRKSVNIEKVDNGFIVRQTIDTGKDYKEKTMIADSEKKAKTLAEKFL